MTKTLLCILFSVAFAGNASSQLYQSCQLKLRGENLNDSLFEAYTNRCIMQANFTTGHFKLSFPFPSVKTNNPYYDTVFARLPADTLFIYEGNFTQNIFDIFRMENDGRQYTIKGKITIGNKEWPCEAGFDPANLQEVTDLSSFRMDVKIVIDPEKIFIPFLDSVTRGPVTLLVNKGPLNAKE